MPETKSIGVARAQGVPPIRKLFLSLVACCVLYANIAVIFQQPTLGTRTRLLPIPQALANAFILFGVFSYFETSNEQLSLWGLPVRPSPGSDTAGWMELDAREHFPVTRGERNSRMWATMHLNNLTQPEHTAVWRSMGSQILSRHQRLHPDQPVSQIAFKSTRWPRSEQGFEALKSQPMTNQMWVIAPWK